MFEDGGRECGTVFAIAAGSAVAAIVGCDRHFAEDQAPTRSVALFSSDGRTWSHHDLDGEAWAQPGLSPNGNHAVWAQRDSLLTWDDGSFRSVPQPAREAQIFTVDDAGTPVTIESAVVAQRCAVKIHTGEETITVAVAASASLMCGEVGLELKTPSMIRGDVSGQPDTQFVVGRTAAGGGWELTAGPPIAAPGLDVYPDDPVRAVWNQLTFNTRGDLVALGSPDRRHITAQRYDPVRKRWSPSRIVHDAGAPVCRRKSDDAGVLQGAGFNLRLFCAGKLLVLHSSTGLTWTTRTPRSSN